MPSSEIGGAVRLLPVALFGQVVAAGLAMGLARWLSLEEFEAFAVAASAFILLVRVVPLGADKLALRVVPPLLARGDPAGIRAFAGFAVRRCLFGAALANLCLLWVVLMGGTPPETRLALIVAGLSLPSGALAHLGLELLTATAAILVLGLVLAGGLGTGAAAIGARGIGWIVALGVMLRRAPTPSWADLARPAPAAGAWRVASRPLWLYRLVVGLMAQAGIIALELSGAAPAEVGAYAAAASLVGLASALVGSTNRVYARQISLLLDRGDRPGIVRLLRRRASWLLPCLGLLLVLAFGFSDPLLALFRAEFIEPGRVALRLLALSAAFSTTLALAPTILKFQGDHRRVLTTLCAAAALQMVLLAWLVPTSGADGAAVGTALATMLLHAGFSVLARRSLARLRSAGRAPD